MGSYVFYFQILIQHLQVEILQVPLQRTMLNHTVLLVITFIFLTNFSPSTSISGFPKYLANSSIISSPTGLSEQKGLAKTILISI